MITDEQQERLKELNRVFLEENTKLNLSALRTEELSWMGNVMDSVAALDMNELRLPATGYRILDIGTGGGFPLLPLAICLPDMKFIGLDSTQKKIDAIQRIVDAMNLSNVELVSGRTEELGRDAAHREQYDIVTARAVAPLNVLLEFASPFVKPGGKILAWKSMNIDQELQDSLMARAELSCQLTGSYKYNLDDWLANRSPERSEGGDWPASRSPERSEGGDWPASRSPERSEGGGWGKRQILIFEKRDTLNSKYPRETGIPKKNPLI